MANEKKPRSERRGFSPLLNCYPSCSDLLVLVVLHTRPMTSHSPLDLSGFVALPILYRNGRAIRSTY